MTAAHTALPELRDFEMNPDLRYLLVTEDIAANLLKVGFTAVAKTFDMLLVEQQVI